jgi:hypothetical protein
LLYALVAVLVLLGGVELGLPSWAVLAAIGVAWVATFFIRRRLAWRTWHEVRRW